MDSKVKIGVLALQGAFIEHEKKITDLGYECAELRQRPDLVSLDGIILPGGESTVQNKLLRELGMFDEIRDMIKSGVQTLATCAGLILLAEKTSNDDNVCFATLPVTVKRNAYGRQLGSFKTRGPFGEMGDVDMTFIRAPYIESASEEVKILSVVDEKIVGVEYKNQIGLSFHPELDSDDTIHRYFLEKVSGAQS